jgi:hypothetical protein
LFGLFCYPVPNRFRPPEEPLYELVLWGIGFAVCAGLALASVRRRPSGEKGVAALALVGSLVCVGLIGWLVALPLFRP